MELREILNKCILFSHSLFSGVTMRTAWITIGGAVFFGFYEKAKYVLQEKLEMNTDHRISA